MPPQCSEQKGEQEIGPFSTSQRIAQTHCHHEQFKAKSKKKAKVNCKDSPPCALIMFEQDGSPDVVLTAIIPVLVLQTTDFCQQSFRVVSVALTFLCCFNLFPL
jgi:hypothetical protein